MPKKLINPNLKKHQKNQNFKERHSAFFVPFLLDLSIATINRKVKNWPFGEGGRGLWGVTKLSIMGQSPIPHQPPTPFHCFGKIPLLTV